MASQQATVDDLIDRLAGAGPLTARKMFGEYCVYLDGKPVALVCDDTLYVKTTAAGRELVPDAAEASPYPGAKPHLALPPNGGKIARRCASCCGRRSRRCPGPSHARSGPNQA